MKENKRPRPQPQFVEEPDGGHTETLTEEEKRQKVRPFCSIYMPGWNGSRDCARSRGIAAILRANYAPFLRAKLPFNAKTR